MRRLRLSTICLLTVVMSLSCYSRLLCAGEFEEIGKLQKQVRELVNSGRYSNAEPLARQMLSRAERSFADRPNIIGGCVADLALVLTYQGQYAEAETLHKRSIEIKEKSLGNQHPDVAVGLCNLANVYQALGRFTEAEQLYQRALIIDEKAFGAENPEVSDILVNLAGMYGTQGRYPEAERLFKRSLAIDEKAFGDKDPRVADILNNLAIIYSDQGRYAEAEPLAKRSLEIKERSLGPDHPQIATSLNTLGSLYYFQGRYADAESLHRRALAIREKMLGEQHTDVAGSLSNLAALLVSQSRYSEAEPLAKRALAIDMKSLGDQHPSVASSLGNLANIYYFQRRYAEAEPLFKQALSIKEKVFGEHHQEVVLALCGIGNLYEAQQRRSEAEPLFKRALEISEKSFGDPHPLIATCLYNLAFLHYRQERYTDAEPLVDRAISIRDRVGVGPQDRFHTYMLRSRINWKLERKQEAIQDLRQALDLAEQVRQQTSGADKERAESFSQFSAAFEQMVAWQMELGDASEALQAIERGRARSLLDEMNRSGSDLNVGRSAREREALRQKESQLKSRIAQLEKQLENADTADRDSLNASLVQARNKLYDQYRNERNSSPVYRNLLSVGSGPPRISQIQRALLANDGVALTYLFGKEAGYVVILTGRQVRLVPLSVDESNAQILGTSAGPLNAARLQEILVENDNKGVVPQLAKPPAQIKDDAQKRLTARLAALWPLLIPAEEREGITSGKYKHLIVVPDGPLALFPFETLVIQGESDPEYLLDNGPPIQYGPSLSVLFNLASRSVIPQGTGKPVLTVADPVYGPESQTPAKPSAGSLVQLASRSRYAGIGGRLTRLPFTSEESKAVAEAFTKAGMSTGSLERDQATESSVRQNITGRKIVHLACHGLTDQAHGNFFGALALTPGKQAAINSADDGFLTLPEIYELDMKGCELAILSACETNYGPQQQGEGVWALSRGFLVSGARRVVASNWLVDDEAGARLISYFCAALARSEKQSAHAEYADQLLAAKKYIRTQSQWKSPYYWSSFVFVGPN